MKVAVGAAIKAGKAILEVYKTDFQVAYKKDHSPLTLADRTANAIIEKALLPTKIPCLSEEGKAIPYSERKKWNRLWIVDPLDGTKEFVKRNDEFTVNIALVENQRVIAGVVYAPVLDLLYVGMTEKGSFRVEKASQKRNLWAAFHKVNELPFQQFKRPFCLVVSRSHNNRETTDFIDKITAKYPEANIVSKGSSLKLCLVAEGSADIYPRFAPTSEWDTAAGHAVVKAAGGNVFQATEGEKEVIYNKENILNPWFVVASKETLMNGLGYYERGTNG